MPTLFQPPPSSHRSFPLDAKLIIPITIVLAVILIISTALDLWGTKRELTHILSEESKALISSIEVGGHNAVESFQLVEDLVAERLLNNARFIERLDYLGRLSADELTQIADENKLFRVALYNKNGNRELSSKSGLGWGNIKPVSKELLQEIQEAGNDELVLGFRSSRFGGSNRYAAAKRRRNGGLVFIAIDAKELLEFRKSIGIGRLIQDIGTNEGIRYIVLQDTSNIIIATQGVDSLSTIASDPFLAQALQGPETLNRYIDYSGDKVFETVHPFDVENKLLLRIALSTGHIKEAQKAAMTRGLLASVLLLIIGTVLANWLISSQNYRQLQQAYKLIETYTGSILDNMSDAVVAVNKEGVITLVNKAAEKIFSISSAEVLGKGCDAEVTSICPYLNTALNDQQAKFYPEEHIMMKSGAKAFEIKANILRDHNEHIESAFLVVQDITEQINMRENLKRRDQITAMGQLASGVAHEIRNPLNAIAMIAQRLNMEFTPTGDVEEYRHLSAIIVSETRRINDIIDQFLQFARPPQLMKRTIDLCRIIRETASLLRQQAEGHNVAISVDCKDLPQLSADGDKLKQALLNLGQNAVQACEKGGQVSFHCDSDGSIVHLMVADTGRGIPIKDRDKIFNLYYTTREEGSGIGLSIVQQIISQHDGTIEFSSQEGQGTVFTIHLPKQE